ncbi:unnamed protein product [Musa textilis]
MRGFALSKIHSTLPLSLSLSPHPSISFPLPIPSTMRIRNRPNPFPPPLFPDPSVHVHPADGEDGRKDSNGGDRGRGRGMLHSDADLEIDNLNRRPPTSEPRLMSSGSSRKATVFAHRANLGRVQVLRKKAKEEDGMVDTSNRWDAEVNGNSRSVNICPHKMEVKHPKYFCFYHACQVDPL